MSEEKIDSRSMNETCDEMEIDVETLSEESIKVMTLVTTWCKKYFSKKMTKQAKEIARLKKRVLKLEKTLENNESKSTPSKSKSTETASTKPVKKGAIIVSEYKDAFLITGSGTYNIKDILKSDFSARWNSDCKGWKISKSTEMTGGGEEMIITIREKVEGQVDKFTYADSNKSKTFEELYG